MTFHSLQNTEGESRRIAQLVRKLAQNAQSPRFDHQPQIKLGVVKHSCVPSTRQVEAGRSKIQGHLQSKTSLQFYTSLYFLGQKHPLKESLPLSHTLQEFNNGFSMTLLWTEC